MTLGERLIQLRAKAGLSQDTLAEQLGVSRQSVSKWENDASVPDLEKLVKLSGVFGVSLDELVKGEVPDSAAPAVKAGVTAEELRLHRQRLVGIAFFLSAVVLYSYALTGPITVWPLLMCGTACLFRRKFLAIICSWGVWLALFSIFGPSLMWLPSGNSVTWMAAAPVSGNFGSAGHPCCSAVLLSPVVLAADFRVVFLVASSSGLPVGPTYGSAIRASGQLINKGRRLTFSKTLKPASLCQNGVGRTPISIHSFFEQGDIPTSLPCRKRIAVAPLAAAIFTRK